MAAAPMASRSDDSEWWMLGVKTVGAELVSPEGDMIPSSFQVRVQPSEDVSILQDRIQDVTGLKHQQQRLIYRGRIIQNKNSSTSSSESPSQSSTKIRDIKGLADGQTIHLVKRSASAVIEGETPTTASARESAESNSSSENSNNNENSNNESSTNSASPSTSLLAALLGMNAMEEAEDSNDNTGSSASPSSGVRRYGTRRSRNHYRLTAEDVQIPDPGSMETVRQGLMTLHTLLPTVETARQHHSAHASGTNNTAIQNTNAATSSVDAPSQSPLNPLAHSRSWYIGQWIDCRDTVNQWLEATITDIVRPDEILPVDRPPLDTNNMPTPIVPALDPAVGTTDLIGRRRLLLEPCDDEEGDPYDLGGELAGYRERRTNNSRTVLLHVHYNGWPHRWDEWIRSDSERIRPFRVRTRHASSSSNNSNNTVAPNIQSVYADTPETFMGGRNDSEDRTFLLHELVRVTGAVHELAQRAAAALPLPETERTAEHLPWISTRQEGERSRDEGLNRESDIFSASQSNSSPSSEQQSLVVSENVSSNQELQTLAPLLDRLGRTLVDAAPHVASFAASNPLPTQPEPDVQNTVTTEDLVDLVSGESNIVEESSDEAADSSRSPSPRSLNGLLSMINSERDRSSQATESETLEDTVDPDHTDFATGFVNVSRGDVRSGPRSRSSRDDLSTLLGAYLAAASLGLGSSGGSDGNSGNSDEGGGELGGLGRLLQSRGNGDGGGIDIHIHAVVTGPGMPPPGLMTGTGGTSNNDGNGIETPTGLGALGLGLGGGTTTSSDLFANTRRATAQRVRATLLEQNNEEDHGIFDDLYSENPDPVATSSSSGGTSGNNDTNRPRRSSSIPRDAAQSTTEEIGSSGSPRRRSRSQRMSGSSNDNGNRGSFFSRMFRRSGGTD